MATVPAFHDPQGGSEQRRSAVAAGWAQRQRAKRQEERERIHARVVHPIDVPRSVRDPLVRHESRVTSTLTAFRLLLAALLLHGSILVVFAIVGRAIGDRNKQPLAERLKVSIVHLPPEPPPPAPEPEPEPESASLARDFDPPPEPKPPKPVSKPKRPKPARPPKAAPPPPSSTEPPKPAQPRRIIGLSMESTVNGPGPAFVTGHSRRGKTDTASTRPPSSAAGSSEGPIGSGASGAMGQRAASRIPTRDIAFEKPSRVRPSEPAYPPLLRAQGVEGEVLVRVSIDARGRVRSVSVLRGSGHAAFDEAARTAALQERFSPAKRGGVAVPFTLSYTYRFRLD